MVNDELILSTKGSLDGDFVKIFKDIFYAENESIRDKFYELSKNNNCSFVFEVISAQDKHMVSYEGDELILLDAIKNELQINGVHVDEGFSNEIISQLDLTNAKLIRNKECEAILEDFESIKTFMKGKRYVENIEGYVFLDKNGFMFKYKNEWYQTWKRIRGLVKVFLKNRHNKFEYYMCKNQTEVSFMRWLEKSQDRVIDEEKFKMSNNIVDLREKYFKEKEE